MTRRDCLIVFKSIEDLLQTEYSADAQAARALAQVGRGMLEDEFLRADVERVTGTTDKRHRKVTGVMS